MQNVDEDRTERACSTHRGDEGPRHELRPGSATARAAVPSLNRFPSAQLGTPADVSHLLRTPSVPRLRTLERPLDRKISSSFGASPVPHQESLLRNSSMTVDVTELSEYSGSGYLPSFQSPRQSSRPSSGALDAPTSVLKGAMSHIRRTGTLSRSSTLTSQNSTVMQRMLHSDDTFIGGVQVALGLVLCAITGTYLSGPSFCLGMGLGTMICSTGALAFQRYLELPAPPAHIKTLRTLLTSFTVVALVVLLLQVLTGKQVDCALAQLMNQTQANAHMIQQNLASDSMRLVQHRVTELEDLVQSLQEHTVAAVQEHHEMSAQRANDLAMLESRLAGLDHDATDLLQNALDALNLAKGSGGAWAPADQTVFDQRVNVANATIKRIKRYHSGPPEERRFSAAEYDRLLSTLNSAAGMHSPSMPADDQVLQILKWRWEESERAYSSLKRMADGKYHETLIDMTGPKHDANMAQASKLRDNFKVRTDRRIQTQRVRAADHVRALEATPEHCQQETDGTWAITFIVMLCFGWQFGAAYQSLLSTLGTQLKTV